MLSWNVMVEGTAGLQQKPSPAPLPNGFSLPIHVMVILFIYDDAPL
jgi:hypothetical protein